jgi:hypothetical protein
MSSATAPAFRPKNVEPIPRGGTERQLESDRRFLHSFASRLVACSVPQGSDQRALRTESTSEAPPASRGRSDTAARR